VAAAAWPEVHDELERLLASALSQPERARSQQALFGAPRHAAAPVSAAASGARVAHHDELAHWFSQLATTLNDAHPRAVEMLGLRLTGLGSREIAERLDLPFRLVDRVLGAVHVQLAGPKAREEVVP
jgi:DNA-directed RNA polymerase specialized sigma24 family protein